MEVKSIPRLELLQVAEAVSREKSIDKEEVITAMEEAIEKAARSKYGLERDIRANINRKNGSINISQYTEVVETVENEATQMTFNESQKGKQMKAIRNPMASIVHPMKSIGNQMAPT